MAEYLDKNGLQHFSEEYWDKIGEKFATKAMVGSPLVAQTAADMTDTDKVYVYTGSETGYTNGDWYYYDGSAWQDGGVYNSAAVVLDDTLTQPDEAAEAKAVGDALKGYAKIDGDYETLGSGTSENLKSSKKETDTEPYNYRTTGGNVDVGSQENFLSLVGGTLALNQLCNGVDSVTSGGLTITDMGDGKIKINGTNTATVFKQFKASTPNSVIGHVYFIARNLISGTFGEGTAETSLNIYNNTNGGVDLLSYKAEIGKALANNVFYLRIYAGTYNDVIIQPMIVDITDLFGTIPQSVGGNSYNSIGDYVYGLNHTNGLAWLYKNFPILNGGYIPYSAPTLGSVCCDKHITTGLNLEPKSAVMGSTWSASGVYTTGSNYSNFGTDSKIRVFPNTDYTISVPNIDAAKGSGYIYRAEFNVNGNFLRRLGGTEKVGGTSKFGVIKTSADCYYIGWFLYRGTAFTADEASEVCFAMTYDGEMNGVYEPYEARTYDMGHETLRGIYMLDSFGNLYCDPSKNDTKEPDGTITRKYKDIDAGTTLTFTASTNNRFIVKINDMQSSPDNNTYPMAFLAGYQQSTGNLYNASDKVFYISTDGYLCVKDTAYNDHTAFEAALVGKHFVYPLATPTTESGTEYTELQKCHNWGTEELTDYEVGQGNRVVSIPVGHLTTYPVDLKAKVEMLPSAPLEDGDYICRVVNGEAQFVPIGSEFPDMPTTDGTFTLKATVSSGTATLSWVADE